MNCEVDGQLQQNQARTRAYLEGKNNMDFLIFCKIRPYLGPHHNAKGRAESSAPFSVATCRLLEGRVTACVAGTALVLSQLSHWNMRDFSNAAA